MPSHHRRARPNMGTPDPARAAERAAYLSERDAAYRAALGIPEGEPIPRTLGCVRGHHNGPATRTPWID